MVVESRLVEVGVGARQGEIPVADFEQTYLRIARVFVPDAPTLIRVSRAQNDPPPTLVVPQGRVSRLALRYERYRRRVSADLITPSEPESALQEKFFARSWRTIPGKDLDTKRAIFVEAVRSLTQEGDLDVEFIANRSALRELWRRLIIGHRQSIYFDPRFVETEE